MDFAVTSGLQIGSLDLSAADGGEAAALYSNRKRTHLSTAAHCAEEGVAFIPMVVEASGGAWTEEALAVLRLLARVSARLTGERPAVLAERFVQNLSITLHRANARANLRRASAGVQTDPALAAARAELAAAEVERAAGLADS